MQLCRSRLHEGGSVAARDTTTSFQGAFPDAGTQFLPIAVDKSRESNTDERLSVNQLPNHSGTASAAGAGHGHARPAASGTDLTFEQQGGLARLHLDRRSSLGLIV